MRRKTKEGTWFAIRLDLGGFSVGVVARNSRRGGIVLAYFFGNVWEAPPSLSEVKVLKAKSAVLVVRVGDLGLIDGTWPIIGRDPEWRREDWPMPQFIRKDELSRKAWIVHYSDNDANFVESEIRTGYETNLEADGVLGAEAAEIALTMVLARRRSMCPGAVEGEIAPRPVQGTRWRHASRQPSAMSKPVRLVDFRIYAAQEGLTMDEQKTANIALFATYYQVRLWLKERHIQAPFENLSVDLGDQTVFAVWHATSRDLLGICKVTEAVDVSTLLKNVQNLRWVIAVVRHALTVVARDTSWACPELEAALIDFAEKGFPLVHFLKSFAVHNKKRGIDCEPWFATQPGLTEIGIRLREQGQERDVVVRSSADPIWLEHAFALAKLKLTDREVLWLDKQGNTLATTPLLESLH